MNKDRLIYLPLGGAGEIGMNLYVYGYGPKDKERLIIVDLGVAFPDMDTTPGVDLIFPDIAWLTDRRNQIEAIFITCLLYTSPSPRDKRQSRMPSSA